MIRTICKDIMFLQRKSIEADVNDKQIIIDLKDTLNANSSRCVGMAANMIGIDKNIIIVSLGLFPLVMVNPKIISKKGPYQTKEGCLSLTGERSATRYKEIEVNYLDENFNKQTNKYTGYTAQIIQHEIDHTNGILI